MVNCNLKKNWNKSSCIKNNTGGEAEFRLVIPKRDNSGRAIKTDVLLKYVRKINKVFGGSTTYPSVFGCYKNEKNEDQCEENVVITGVRDFDSRFSPELNNYSSKKKQHKLKNDYNKLIALGKKASKELGQEAIFVESDYINDASFVSRNKKTRKEKISDSKVTSDSINFEKFIKKS